MLHYCRVTQGLPAVSQATPSIALGNSKINADSTSSFRPTVSFCRRDTHTQITASKDEFSFYYTMLSSFLLDSYFTV